MRLEDPRPAPDRPGKEPLAPLPEPLPLPPTPEHGRRVYARPGAHGYRTFPSAGVKGRAQVSRIDGEFVTQRSDI
jgi:hypothetical protein